MDFVVRECREGTPFHHIHGVGKRYYQRVLDAVQAKGIDLDRYPDVDVREYIYDMPAGDGRRRRGAHAGRAHPPSLRSPPSAKPLHSGAQSPNVTANHQEKNARVLGDKGAAVLLLEKDAGGDQLYDTVQPPAGRPGGAGEHAEGPAGHGRRPTPMSASTRRCAHW